jgi:hypothetical protein
MRITSARYLPVSNWLNHIKVYDMTVNILGVNSDMKGRRTATQAGRDFIMCNTHMCLAISERHAPRH